MTMEPLNPNNAEVNGINSASRSDISGTIAKLSSKLINWIPPIWVTSTLGRFFIPIVVWAVVYLLIGEAALPPKGPVFAIIILAFFGIAFGQLVNLIKLPPLLGMLTLGIVIRNVPRINYGTSLTPELSSPIRQLALVIILIRAGLGLDPEALMKLKGVVIRLAFFPCIAEAITVTIASHFILEFPWQWGLLLGFVLAAVSPAVIVPCLLSLQELGLGVDKGIPTIVIAAASVDDILAISAFGLVLGFTFSTGESLFESIIQGPLELGFGIGFGIMWGCLLGVVFSRTSKEDPNADVVRVLLTLGGGCLSVFGFQYIGYPGSGALGCLAATFVAAVFWREKGIVNDSDTLTWSFAVLWVIFQPLLFGLIGCEIDLERLDPAIVGLGIICLVLGLTVRLLVSFISVSNSDLTLKEKLFVAVAWVPKATVQAAIGPVALDTARQFKAGKESEELGLQVLTIAVLVILITAPIGATAVMTLGPKLLRTRCARGSIKAPCRVYHPPGPAEVEGCSDA